MPFADVVWTPRGFGQTARRDWWWIQPIAVFLGLSTFFVYANWAAFQGKYYYWGPYLSPFYSPLFSRLRCKLIQSSFQQWVKSLFFG